LYLGIYYEYYYLSCNNIKYYLDRVYQDREVTINRRLLDTNIN